MAQQALSNHIDPATPDFHTVLLALAFAGVAFAVATAVTVYAVKKKQD